MVVLISVKALLAVISLKSKAFQESEQLMIDLKLTASLLEFRYNR